MKLNIVAYITIILLIIIILLQNKSCKRQDDIQPIKIDTVVRYDTIKKIIPGKIIFIKQKIDTSIWMKKPGNVPSKNIDSLKTQYLILGNKFFAENTFSTKYSLGEYGSVTAIDTISENKLIGSKLITNLTIPEKTITITKEAPLKRELYVGGFLSLTESTPVSGVYGGILYKDKKSRIFSLNVGWTGEPTILGGTYWKLGNK